MLIALNKQTKKKKAFMDYGKHISFLKYPDKSGELKVSRSILQYIRILLKRNVMIALLLFFSLKYIWFIMVYKSKIHLPMQETQELRVWYPWVGKIPWSRKWQPGPVFLPGQFHRQMSLVVYSPWGHKESDVTERLSTWIYVYIYIYMYTFSDSFPL